MEQFHWTEKDLYTEVTYLRVMQISEFNEAKAIADKIKERTAGHKPGTISQRLV